MGENLTAAEHLLSQGYDRFGTILANPPWQFTNRTGKVAPEHRRLSRYSTMTHQDIMELPVPQLAAVQSHLYLWVPNALILEGLEVMKRWGFTYKTNLVWYKIRKDGGPDGRGVGFYFRNVTELVLFGTRGKLRTLEPGRTQVNVLATQKRGHSRKPDEIYTVVEQCSPGPYLEMFARYTRAGWSQWGNEVEADMRVHVDESLASIDPEIWYLFTQERKNPYGSPIRRMHCSVEGANDKNGLVVYDLVWRYEHKKTLDSRELNLTAISRNEHTEIGVVVPTGTPPGLFERLAGDARCAIEDYRDEAADDGLE